MQNNNEILICDSLDELEQLKELKPRALVDFAKDYYGEDEAKLFEDIFLKMDYDINNKEEFLQGLKELNNVNTYGFLGAGTRNFLYDEDAFDFCQGSTQDCILNVLKKEAQEFNCECLSEFVYQYIIKNPSNDNKVRKFDVIEDLFENEGFNTKATFSRATLEIIAHKIIETNILDIPDFVNQDELLKLMNQSPVENIEQNSNINRLRRK